MCSFVLARNVMHTRKSVAFVCGLVCLAHGLVAQSWKRLSVNGSPPADRVSNAFVFDQARDRFVMFGGANGLPVQFDDTWEWDNSAQTWQSVANGTPSARSVMAAAFDPVRNVSVVWGGALFQPSSVGTFYNDTWEWDGSSWQQGPTVPVAGRCGARIVYDTARSQMVLFGGQGQSSFANDLWSYDGVGWTQLDGGGANAPSPRFFHGMAYDVERDRVVVFGGSDGSTQFGDTWEWDGASWSQVTGSSPPARSEQAMEYHPEADATVLYGGKGASGALGDTWLYKAGRWFEVSDQYAPAARRHAVLTYSSQSDKMVMYGGQDAGVYNEVWELTLPDIFDVSAMPVTTSGPKPTVADHAMAPLPGGGALLFGGEDAVGPFYPTFELHAGAWSKQSSILNPLTRTRSTLVLDEARQENMLFGGMSPQGVPLADTWTYAGGQWSYRQPGNAPSPRSGHAVTFDPETGACLLFGGEDAGGTQLSDMWSWDGNDWSLVVTATVPPGRSGHGLVYDAFRERVIMFGGLGATGRLDDVWEYDGDNWIRAAQTPPQRTGALLEWDSNRGRLLQMAGTSFLGGSDFWQLRPSASTAGERAWSRILSSPTPSPRNNAYSAFDPVRDELVVFGGSAGGVGLGDTWLFDGANWTQANPANQPPDLFGGRMVFHAATGKTVLFGGFSPSAGFTSATWEWDGVDWTQASPQVSPSPRTAMAMAYDAGRNRLVMFGGRLGTNVLLSETWEYDGFNWVLVSTGGPSPRRDCVMAYDPIRGETVLFGGQDNGGALRETWVWDGSVWQQRAPVDAPPGALQAAMAFDVTAGVVTLFGGATFGYTKTYDQTWEWDGSEWSPAALEQAGADVNPGAIDSFAMAYDPRSERVVVIGGSDGATCSDGVWTWNGGRWTRHLPASGTSLPSARRGAVAIVDGAFDQLQMLGGECGGTYSDELWEVHLPIVARSSVFGQGCPGSNGVPTLALDPATPPVVGGSLSLTYSNAASVFLPVIVTLGSDNTAWQGAPLPLDLTAAGLPGCFLLTSTERNLDLAFPNASLQATVTAVVPNIPLLLGQDFFFQGLHLELATWPNWAALSAGVEVRVGDR